MVAHFLRLKLQLLANSFRRGPWQVFGLVVAVLYGIGAAVLCSAGLLALRFFDEETARSFTIIGGSLIVAGFAVVPLMFGLDDALDPRRFSLFGLDNTKLSLALLVAALVSVPTLALLIVVLSQIVTWTRLPGLSFLALLGAVLTVATCVLAARVTTSVAAFLLATRRAREFSAILGLLVLVLLSPIVFVLAGVDWATDDGRTARAFADTLAWTPLGAAWAIPGDAAIGDGGGAFLHLLIAVATPALLWLAWTKLVAWMLVSPEREGRAKSYAGLGWFDRLPDNPGGAIAARSATYWARDPRYWVSLVVVPFTPIIVMLPLLVVGVPGTIVALIPVPVFSLLLGWSLHNDTAYDNTAVWQHVVSGIRGRSDRLGRLFPALAFGVPIILVGSVVSAYFFGDWAGLGGILGISLSLLLAGMGLSSITSARFPYAVVRPGDSPFSQPQNTGATVAFVQTVSFLVTAVLSAPAIVLAVLGYVSDPVFYTWSLVAGLATGLLVLAVGVWIGSRIFRRRGPEILAASLQAA